MSRPGNATVELDRIAKHHRGNIIAEFPDFKESPGWEAIVRRLWSATLVPRLEALERQGRLTALQADLLKRGRALLEGDR